MNLSDTFYVALCMTVLILGVVYWFWTQNQYIQRKLNLLENIVYEMKTSLHASAPDDGLTPPSGVVASNTLEPATYAPAPSSVLGEDEDIAHEELMEEAIDGPKLDNDAPAVPLSAADVDVPDALQPGGVGSGVKDVVVPDMTTNGTMLDTMTLKELKRLGERKGISGVSKMAKQALIDAIRAAPVTTPFNVETGTLELS